MLWTSWLKLVDILPVGLYADATTKRVDQLQQQVQILTDAHNLAARALIWQSVTLGVFMVAALGLCIIVYRQQQRITTLERLLNRSEVGSEPTYRTVR